MYKKVVLIFGVAVLFMFGVVIISVLLFSPKEGRAYIPTIAEDGSNAIEVLQSSEKTSVSKYRNFENRRQAKKEDHQIAPVFNLATEMIGSEQPAVAIEPAAFELEVQKKERALFLRDSLEQAIKEQMTKQAKSKKKSRSLHRSTASSKPVDSRSLYQATASNKQTVVPSPAPVPEVVYASRDILSAVANYQESPSERKFKTVQEIGQQGSGNGSQGVASATNRYANQATGLKQGNSVPQTTSTPFNFGTNQSAGRNSSGDFVRGQLKEKLKLKGGTQSCEMVLMEACTIGGKRYEQGSVLFGSARMAQQRVYINLNTINDVKTGQSGFVNVHVYDVDYLEGLAVDITAAKEKSRAVRNASRDFIPNNMPGSNTARSLVNAIGGGTSVSFNKGFTAFLKI